MASLTEKLQKSLGTKQTAQFGGQAQKAADLLRAKSGRAGISPSGPAASSLAEKAAVGQTQLQLDQQTQQGKMLGQQIGGAEEAQTTQFAQQRESQALSMEGLRQQAEQKADTILNQFEQGGKKLDAAGDRAQLEQAGFDVRLSSKQYVDELLREGNRNRLDNDLSFKEAIQADVFRGMEYLFRDKMQFNEMMTMSDADFAKEMQTMELDYAMKVAKESAKAAAKKQQFDAITGGVSGVTQMFGSGTGGAAGQKPAPGQVVTGTGSHGQSVSYEQAGPPMQNGNF